MPQHYTFVDAIDFKAKRKRIDNDLTMQRPLAAVEASLVSNLEEKHLDRVKNYTARRAYTNGTGRRGDENER